MATRRIISTEKTGLDRDEIQAQQQQQPSDVTPAVASSTIAKLLFFTFAMITVPIGSYFLTVNSIFKGNATYAGGLAALMANVVLIGYVIVAFQDDKSEREADAAAEAKKSK